MKEKVLSGHVSPVKASDDFLGRSAPSEAGEMNQALGDLEKYIRPENREKWKEKIEKALEKMREKDWIDAALIMDDGIYPLKKSKYDEGRYYQKWDWNKLEEINEIGNDLIEEIPIIHERRRNKFILFKDGMIKKAGIIREDGEYGIYEIYDPPRFKIRDDLRRKLDKEKYPEFQGEEGKIKIWGIGYSNDLRPPLIIEGEKGDILLLREGRNRRDYYQSLRFINHGFIIDGYLIRIAFGRGIECPENDMKKFYFFIIKNKDGRMRIIEIPSYLIEEYRIFGYKAWKRVAKELKKREYPNYKKEYFNQQPFIIILDPFLELKLIKWGIEQGIFEKSLLEKAAQKMKIEKTFRYLGRR